MTEGTNRSGKPLILLALLVFVALLLRLPNIDQSIWFDEACMTKQRTGTFAILITTLYTDIHPPSYYFFLYGWNNLFGDSELSIRLPPLLCGLASLPLTYIVGRRLVGLLVERLVGQRAGFRHNGYCRLSCGRLKGQGLRLSLFGQ